MKSLLTLCFLVWCNSSQAEWIFHSAETINPFVNFTTDGTFNVVSGFEFLDVEYGVDNYQAYTSFADQWVGEGIKFDGTWWSVKEEVVVSGKTFTYSGPLLLYVVYIEGPFPDFLGGDLFSGLTEGEYWLDVDTAGNHGRVSSSQPLDFGEYLWDGSINPNYVAPISLKKHHGRKT